MGISKSKSSDTDNALASLQTTNQPSKESDQPDNQSDDKNSVKPSQKPSGEHDFTIPDDWKEKCRASKPWCQKFFQSLVNTMMVAQLFPGEATVTIAEDIREKILKSCQTKMHHDNWTCFDIKLKEQRAIDLMRRHYPTDASSRTTIIALAVIGLISLLIGGALLFYFLCRCKTSGGSHHHKASSSRSKSKKSKRGGGSSARYSSGRNKSKSRPRSSKSRSRSKSKSRARK